MLYLYRRGNCNIDVDTAIAVTANVSGVTNSAEGIRDFNNDVTI